MTKKRRWLKKQPTRNGELSRFTFRGWSIVQVGTELGWSEPTWLAMKDGWQFPNRTLKDARKKINEQKKLKVN
tara:strand:+ start:295 stop:513 length:219 start_codon:yes stop_codon:yes gene_type:complete